MVFSSFSFLFVFLPLFFLGYGLIRNIFYQNIYLFVASLTFYYVGEKRQIWILIASILINYGFGLLVDRAKRKGRVLLLGPKSLVGCCVVANLILLGYFKYITFLTTNVAVLAHGVGVASPVSIIHAALPLGISFYTFHALSYVIDVYRGEVKATRNLINVGTYFTMFPQLVAGPILRYNMIASAMVTRVVTADMMARGIYLFILGLAKKVVFADTFAMTADAIFALPTGQVNFGIAWLGTLAYTFQIFFDFWGYSQMAIGLGLMMGFNYPRNFDYPYISRTIQEFWRRWHMTLSFWFRDYVYIPLGGNRKGLHRTYCNLIAVFFLTGLWHGASWTFVVWGLWHGGFLLLERIFSSIFKRLPAVVLHLYTLAVVVFGWVLFRATSFREALLFWKIMVGAKGFGSSGVTQFASPGILILFAAAALFSTPLPAIISAWIVARQPRLGMSAALGAASIIFLISGMKVLSGSFSPFLYFRF
ncbi:MBOAT family O-acyltransferase [Caballeronia sordidicola]|uniref:Probable alginate O-acetylase AlgI n=1 Tax=Caballeronia sordidicola TaxID=196367 RepID=A0A226X384_CABSO|nr:MBOAT family O-acyltransferase [Caballeronia sordidicola]OXC77916.1 putative poly(beta-D-mannuronate) O-acetylase [Caballeronia sordidicola]